MWPARCLYTRATGDRCREDYHETAVRQEKNFIRVAGGTVRCGFGESVAAVLFNTTVNPAGSTEPVDRHGFISRCNTRHYQSGEHAPSVPPEVCRSAEM